MAGDAVARSVPASRWNTQIEGLGSRNNGLKDVEGYYPNNTGFKDISPRNILEKSGAFSRGPVRRILAFASWP